MSSLRISGLASGMDTDAMVQSLMKVERMKVDRFEQSKQTALWRQEQYNNINKIFANFILNTRKDMGLNRVSMTGGISNTAYNRLDYIRSATSSNEGAVGVSSTSQAVNGSFDIEVKELAKSATYASAKVASDITFGDKLELEIKMGTKENGVDTIKTLNISVAPQANSSEITMADIARAINAEKDGVTAFYDKNNGRLFVQSTETGSVKVEGNEVLIELNAKSWEGATEAQKAKISEFNAAVNRDGEIDGMSRTAGANIIVEYNGITLEYSSNRFELNGLSIEAKSTGTTTIKVETNVQGIYDKIEQLVNDYNELIDKASSLLGEKRYPSYHPLSMEEKKAMHEDDVKLWEERAKSGLLNNDETINRTLQSMRRYLYEEVDTDSKYNQITTIGITTEKYARGTAGGKLQIDRDKLMNAIMDDPEAVMGLLFREPKYGEDKLEKVSSSTNERTLGSDAIAAKRSQSGIFNRIYDELISGMQSIIDKSGSGENADLYRTVKSNILLDFVTNKSSISDIDRDVLNMNKRIDDLNVMLLRKENAYYAKFANMEKMLHQMYSQSDWLAQQFIR